MSIIRSYYTFKSARSFDKTYHIIVVGFWTSAEMAVGIIVSCLPVLPRLIQYVGPRISSAFSSEVKTRDMTPGQRKVDKSFLGELSNWDEVRTAVNGNSSSELPERSSTIDPSQASLARTLDRLDRLDRFDRLDHLERLERLERLDPLDRFGRFDRLDRLSPGTLPTLPWLGEQPPGQILRTIHIETKTEPAVISDSEFHMNVERHSLGSKR